MFATGSPAALRQFRRSQPSCQRVTPLRTYSLSVWRITRQGRFSASRALVAAVSSIRLLVVAGSPPESSRSTPRKRRIAAQPPGPGLGLQPPSVQISTTWAPSSEAIGPLVPRLQVKAQPAQIFERVLARHQRVVRSVQ